MTHRRSPPLRVGLFNVAGSVAAAPLFLVVLLTAVMAGSASANSHIGNGHSGEDKDADCLRWDVVFATDTGADAGDAGDAGAPSSMDGGTLPPGAKLVCLEHATLFGCECGLVDRTGGGLSIVTSATLLMLIAAALFRARRARRRGHRTEANDDRRRSTHAAAAKPTPSPSLRGVAM